MATRANYGNDTRGFICKARTLHPGFGACIAMLFVFATGLSPESPGVCLSIKVSKRVLDHRDIFCAHALLHLRHISSWHNINFQPFSEML